jgi:hypothetical protein
MLQKFLKSDNAISHSEIDEARMIYLKINSFKRRKALRKDLNIYLKNCKKQSLRPSIVEYFKKRI